MLKSLFTALVGISSLSTISLAETAFEPAKLIKVGGKRIATEAPGYSFPVMVDLDKDGLKDLIVAQFMHGKMMFLKNVGTPKEPKFNEIKWLRGADGKRARIPNVF